MATLVKQKVSLVIKQSQIAAFSDYMYTSFEKKALAHLRKKYPVSTKEMTDDALNSLIKDGINKAAKHNIIERPDVLSYLEFMLILGLSLIHI